MKRKMAAALRCFCTVLLVSVLSSCTTVLHKDLMKEGTRNPDLTALVRNPDLYRNKLFILGGTIAHTTLTPEGSEIEALYEPVDAWGFTEGRREIETRYRAIYPKDKGLLDPLIYRRDRNIAVAAVFAGVVTGHVDKMEYVFPVFTIVEIHLERRYYAGEAYPYYPYGYWGPGWWGVPPPG